MSEQADIQDILKEMEEQFPEEQTLENLTRKLASLDRAISVNKKIAREAEEAGIVDPTNTAQRMINALKRQKRTVQLRIQELSMSNTATRPRNATAAELSKVGVILLSERTFTLECAECGQVWSPNVLEGGRLPAGYWKCPNGCNVPD